LSQKCKRRGKIPDAAIQEKKKTEIKNDLKM
jgi:hypothetical protein